VTTRGLRRTILALQMGGQRQNRAVETRKSTFCGRLKCHARQVALLARSSGSLDGASWRRLGHDSAAWVAYRVAWVLLGHGPTLVPGAGCAGNRLPDWRLCEAQPQLNLTVKLHL
jgi:hypothetical protein